VRRLNIQLN
jgi:hypothetical protein